eukprot:314760-Hanusia_phi.AAC.1
MNHACASVAGFTCYVMTQLHRATEEREREGEQAGLTRSRGNVMTEKLKAGSFFRVPGNGLGRDLLDDPSA